MLVGRVLLAGVGLGLIWPVLAVADPTIALTPEERAWLHANPHVKLALDPHSGPTQFADAQGKADGIIPEIAQHLSRAIGQEIEFELKREKETIHEAARRPGVYGLASGFRTPKTESMYRLTDAYMTTPFYVITEKQKRQAIRQAADLKGRTVAVPEGHVALSSVVEAAGGKVVPVASPLDQMEKVMSGEADALIGYLNYPYLMNKYLMTELAVAFVIQSDRGMHIGVNPENPLLQGILNKAIATLDKRTVDVIFAKWTDLGRRGQSPTRLTPQEQAWLAAHPVIRLASDPNGLPLERTDRNGLSEGIAADFIELIGQRLGVKFVPSPVRPRAEVRDMVKRRELDVLTAAVATGDLEDRVAFTAPYLSHPILIITTDKVNYIDGIAALAGKTVALEEGDAIGDLVRREYPGLRIDDYPDSLSAMQAVSDGRAYAYLGSLVNAGYNMRAHGITNLKVSGQTSYRHEVGLGVRSDWPELVVILQRALDSIGQEEKNAIFQRWIAVEVAPRIDYRLIGQVVAISLVVLLAILYWNWWLRRERTAALAARMIAEQARQELILARDAAEAANRAKSVFLANMSHELRTPLNAILGFSEMIGQDRGMPAAVQDKVGLINRAGAHLLSMINDVLDLAKIESGKLKLEPEPTDLHALIGDLGRMFEARARAAGLRFRWDLAPDTARHVSVDADKLRQVLINLLGNALKFTEEGGFALRARTRPEETDPARLRLHVEVQDSGPGIPPDKQRQLFKPFEQLGHPLTGSQKGTGLGLSISRALVELMGGQIGVESEPGKGALFWVEVPVQAAEAGEVPGGEERRPEVLGLAPDQPACRVLVAEDDEQNRTLLVGLLQPAGFEVRVAEDGEQAIAQFQAWQPHLIWMDMRMPVLDGFEATRRIRGLPGGDAVKIVAITASAFKDQRGRILEAGCDEIVHKPYRRRDIFQTMGRLLGLRYVHEGGAPGPGSAGGTARSGTGRGPCGSRPGPAWRTDRGRPAGRPGVLRGRAGRTGRCERRVGRIPPAAGR